MARRRKSIPQESSFFDDLSPHTKQAIAAIFFVVLAIFFIFSSLGYAGIAGEATHDALYYLFGYGFILAPLVCGLFVYVFLKPREDERVSISKLIGVTLFFIASLGLLDLSLTEGGMLGTIVLYPLVTLFGEIVAGIILFALFLVGLFLTFNTNLLNLFKRNESDEEEEVEPEITLPLPSPDDENSEEDEDAEEGSDEGAPKKRTLKEKLINKVTGAEFAVSSFRGTYAPPPLSLLNRDKGTPDVGDVKANSITIKRTLQKFNIAVEMDAVTIGSSVTRYAIKPAEGVKLEKIVGLQTNLEYALAASPIRIEAPIPGKSLVGIEIPNKQKQMIGLASLFASPEYTDSPKPLLVAL